MSFSFPLKIIKRKNTKNIYIRVKSTGIEVSANKYAKTSFINELIKSKENNLYAYYKKEEEKAKQCWFLGEILNENIEDKDNFYTSKAHILENMFYKISEDVKLKASSLKFSKAKKRWGSCSHKNSISLSLYLLKLPPHLIAYVITHELCHIKHKNHSKDFYNLLNSFCDVKKLEKELKTYERRF